MLTVFCLNVIVFSQLLILLCFSTPFACSHLWGLLWATLAHVQVATFSVHAHSPYTVAQPLYETLPVRLACSGYNGTVFSLLPFPEDEIAYAAVEHAVQVSGSMTEKFVNIRMQTYFF